MSENKNSIIIISGPAGSGKNTVAERLIADFENVKRVVTTTSRPPRGQEVNGIDYHFLATEDFENGIENGDFYEYAKVHDKYYGTSKRAILDSLEAGFDIILIIDVQGAKTWKSIAEKNPEIGEKLTRIFVAPDSIEELVKRLRNRATESEEEIARRMQTAVSEFEQADDFEIVINSKSKDEDYNELKEIYLNLKK